LMGGILRTIFLVVVARVDDLVGNEGWGVGSGSGCGLVFSRMDLRAGLGAGSGLDLDLDLWAASPSEL
jgi:hypothetical protein